MVGIGLAVSNLSRFLLSEKRHSGNKCQYYHPMLSFYVWIVLDFLANIIWLILSVTISAHFYNPMMKLIDNLPATFKVLIGIEQIWLMIELIMQISMATRIL